MSSEPTVTLSVAVEMGLLEEEYQRILAILGRTPTYTELGIFAVMWSEHCSYKNSIAQLKTLPREGGQLLVKAGEENAGLVDIGDGLAIAFKIESHNHPSAVEPYQGAATGVGGILRDIFTMGARPIAALNSLRFGPLTDERVRYLFKNAVKGIGDYGNSFGVPTVAGEIYFEDCYRSNCLVNAMAVGIVEHAKTAKASAGKAGCAVLIVGSATGKDGIHGATFASEEINEESEQKRPSVQVGDPFTEKLLLEATLEAIGSGLVVGIQDMGAAGLTCSCTEMSARAGIGMQIDLDKVPLREEGMSAYEIMLSESQERMLLVVEHEKVGAVSKIFEKWELPCVVIGETTSNNRVQIFQNKSLKADVPPFHLTLGNGAPVYDRAWEEPKYLTNIREQTEFQSITDSEIESQVYRVMEHLNVASKAWAYEQYDSMVQDNFMQSQRLGAGVIRIKGTNKAISVTTDCNSRYVYLNPRLGTQIAVAEAARNVVCTGAKPLAITNCLNFGNPYNPEVFWQFKESIAGMGEACRVLETPVTGGNVSFYNEAPNDVIYPTPVIGMLGLIDSVSDITKQNFNSAGDAIVVLGRESLALGGSVFQSMNSGSITGDAPPFDLAYEKRVQQLTLQLIKSGVVKSANDVSEGGLVTAILESCFYESRNFGAEISIGETATPLGHRLFSESQSRIILSVSPDKVQRVLELAVESDIEATHLGRVTKEPVLRINGRIAVDVERARDAWQSSIAKYMDT